MLPRGRVVGYVFKKFKPTPFDTDIGARLPAAYKKFYDEWKNTKPEPVHYIPKPNLWERTKDGEVKRVVNIPIPGFYTKELHRIFTGGEEIIQGFLKKSLRTNRVPKFWMPTTYNSVVYSEILNKYMTAIMTKRFVELVHKHKGFDNYILQTKACDLKSLVAIKMKQKLLLALANKDLPYDEEKNEMIYEKYKQYLIPKEEIEWYGLTITEAFAKQQRIEEDEKNASKVPLKHVFRAHFIEYLKNSKDTVGTVVSEKIEQKGLLGKAKEIFRFSK